MDIKSCLLCHFLIILSISVFFYLLYLIFYKSCKKKVKSFIKPEEMPKIIPLPIATKNIKNPFKKILKWIFEVRDWKLIEDWEFNLDENTVLIIEKGYEFDGASIPKIFWSILSPVGLLLLPALIHDHGYQHNYVFQKTKDEDGNIIYEEFPKNFDEIKNKRKYWDDLFFKMSNDINGVKIIGIMAWVGVRCFGWKPWNDYRDEEEIKVSGKK